MAPDTRGFVGLFGTPRNTLLSKWNTLFDQDAKEWIAFKPALGLHVYPCYSCRHMFYSKKSFQDHINRRAVVLKYKCPGCPDQEMVYYNRCSLQLHCRKHYSIDKGIINLNNLEVSSLPVGLAGFAKHPHIPYLFDFEEEYNVGNTFVNAQFYAPKIEEKGKEAITLTPTHLVINRTDQNGENQALALKQVAINIPKCQFITLQNLREIRKQMQQFVDEEPDVKMEALQEDHQQISFCEEPYVYQSQAELTSEQDSTPNASNSEITTEIDLDDITLPVITKIETVEEPLSPQLKYPPLFPKQKCPECGNQIEEPLKHHFVGENRPTTEKLRCHSCKLICPTACSFRAHVRLHDRVPPFVCPDCGETFPEVDDLIQHMDDVCFHSAKSVRYRCPGRRCGKIFASEATFGPHYKQLHIDTLFQCGKCKEIFTAVQACEVHLRTHEDGASMVKFFSCITCGADEMTPQELKKHIEFHCRDLTRCMYIFMCKFCKCYFRSVTTMATHLKNCKVQKTGVPRRIRPTTNTNPYMNSKYVSGECLICKNRIICLKNKITPYCSKCALKPTYPGKKNPPLSQDQCICILCKKQIEFEERRKHQSECQYGKPQVLVEKIDSEKISDYATLLNQSFSSSNSDPEGSYEVSSPQKTRSDSGADENRPRKRHRPSKPKKPEVENDLTAEEPMTFDGTYECRQCEFKDTDRAAFHEHIKVHRHISTAYQCMECGECFVVKPSLLKHLLHYHNIWDHQQYFMDNDCFDQSAVTELAKVVRAPYLANCVKENQCKVCMEQFDCAEKHDNHFRTHGMAFLMRNSV